MQAVVIVTEGWAILLAFAALILLLLLAHLLIVTGQPAASDDETEGVTTRRRGVKALVMGADGRASTSKVQAVLWTFAIWYAFVFMLLWGRSLGCDQEGLPVNEVASCTEAAKARTSFTEFVGRELQADYYVLLGFPLGVAVAAKALTTSKVTSGTITKPPNESSEGVVDGLRETVSNDRGETELLDFQYFAFNLVALAFFWTEFLTKPAGGLPDLPATLIGLSGLSAAAYTTRKALETDVRPGVTAVIPKRLVLAEGSRITVVGSGFGERDPDAPLGPPPAVTGGEPPAWLKLDGISLQIERWQPTRIEAMLTAECVSQRAGLGSAATTAELVVDVTDGPPSEPVAVELVSDGGP